MDINKSLIGGSTILMILSILDKEDLYGYQLIKELEEKSENKFKFKEGTLYPILHKMENANFLNSYKATGENSKERKYYKITPEGKRQLLAEKESWKKFVVSVNMVIGGGSCGLA